jgi:hypothetical protein
VELLYYDDHFDLAIQRFNIVTIKGFGHSHPLAKHNSSNVYKSICSAPNNVEDLDVLAAQLIRSVLKVYPGISLILLAVLTRLFVF